MLSRRKFNFAVGACGLYLLTGCDNGSKQRIVTEAAIDIAGIFWSNPVVKLLRFLKIISTSLAQFNHDANSNTARFETTNPRVTGTVNLLSNDEYGSSNFTTPNSKIDFSPGRFMRLNDLQFGDEGRLNYVDGKLLEDYTQCTDSALNFGEGNQIRLLELRLQCFEGKGYGQVNLDYMRVKYENYSI